MEKYHEGIIVLSGGVGSEVYSHVVSDDIAGLDATIKWYKQTFGVDYYLELQRRADFDLTQLLPFDFFSKKFCLNISELGLEIV